MSESNGFADRLTLLSGLKRRYADYELPVSRLKVRVQSVSESESVAIERENLKRNDDGETEFDEDKVRQLRARWIAYALVDGDGKRILNDADIPQVMEMDSGDTAYLYDRIREHCGMARRVTELKNS